MSDNNEQVTVWLRTGVARLPKISGVRQVTCSLTDQVLAVGGTFIANIVLARTQTKNEYGMFVLSYSLYAFLFGLYHAAILDPYTVFAAGRYRRSSAEYLRLIASSTALTCFLLGGLLLATYLLLLRYAPHVAFRALLGLALSTPILLTGHLIRRIFYLQQQPALAAKFSLVAFFSIASLLWLTAKIHLLNSLSVFLVLALGVVAATLSCVRDLPFGSPAQPFLEREPNYWREHWKYAKWVLATAFVFQFSTQGYFWVVGGILSLKEVGDLKAMYLLVASVDQIFISCSYLLIPALAARCAANRTDAFISLWKKYVLATTAITTLFALFMRVFGRAMIHLLYRGKYDSMGSHLFVLALLPLFLGIGNSINNALVAREKSKLVFFAYLCSAAATFLGGIPLVIYFGLWGAVYGMLFSGVIYTGTLALTFAFRFPRQTAPLPTLLLRQTTE